MKITKELASLPPSAGSVDVLTLRDQHLEALGWMFQPGQTFEYIVAYLDGKHVGRVRHETRPDVAKAHEWSADAQPTAFGLEVAIDGPAPARLDLVGHIGSVPVARLSCYLPSSADKTLPQPPDVLADRVSGFHGEAFRTQGLRMFTDLADQMDKLEIPTSGRILDWGCGCGRVTHYFLTRLPAASVSGCDIDAQAIEWCRENYGTNFIRVETTPPTPFKDAAVDVVIACSVLTHLSAADQDIWLAEMRRVLAPGGYFFASTHGEYAFRMAHPGQVNSPDQLAGIIDSQLDTTLDGIAPDGYYRAAFQSQEHTLQVCSKYFEVVQYVERGLCGHQDLVILRRPK